jgi:hypothetical protein
MQPLKPHPLFPSHAQAILLLLALVSQGCGWRKTMSFPSKSGQNAVEISQTRLDNSWGFRVELVRSNRRLVLFESHREAIIYFVHAYWSNDGTKLGVVATGANIWHLAWDIKSAKPIPFEEIRPEVAQSISQAYRVPPGEDPIQWAAMSDAQGEFFRRHPEIHLSHHPGTP